MDFPCGSVVTNLCAAAKSLQSCPTLCNPIDGSPPGSTVPGILQASTLEWVAISSSSAWKWKVNVKSLSCVRLFVTPWTAAYLAPPSMGFPRQEYWSGVPYSQMQVQFLGWEDLVEKVNDNPLQYSCLGNSVDRRAWWVIVHGTAKELGTIYGLKNTNNKDTYIHSFVDSIPLQVIMEYWVEFFVLYSRFLLVTNVIYSSVYMSIPISHFIPPPLASLTIWSLFSISIFDESIFFCESIFVF